MNKIKRFASKSLGLGTIENYVRDATSNKFSGPTTPQLLDMAEMTYTFEGCQSVMRILWKRINDHGKNWPHIYKGLLVIHYLLVNGHESVINEVKGKLPEIRTLEEFQYIDKVQGDTGQSIREKAKQIVQIIDNKESLDKARKENTKSKPVKSTDELDLTPKPLQEKDTAQPPEDENDEKKKKVSKEKAKESTPTQPTQPIQSTQPAQAVNLIDFSNVSEVQYPVAQTTTNPFLSPQPGDVFQPFQAQPNQSFPAQPDQPFPAQPNQQGPDPKQPFFPGTSQPFLQYHQQFQPQQ